MATALELTRTGWQHYLERAKLRPKQLRPRAQDMEERDRLLALVQDAARVLKSRFRVRRVILIGSLANEETFSSRSDVDLAVEGLREDDFWEAWRMVEEIIGDRQVDFVDMENAGESVRQTIQRYGVEL